MNKRTKKSTSSFPARQAIDECGGICYPSSTPNRTTLSNCTVEFTGLVAGAWYAVAIQVEDFINSTSNQSMSSVPVQFLIYVLPTPQCSSIPEFTLSVDCLEAQIGVPMNFVLYATNDCDPEESRIADIVVSKSIPGMKAGNLTQASDQSYAWVIYTWTPQSNQYGPQQFCAIAFTSERVQSEEYCVVFDVLSGPACTTTTSTSTSTTTTTETTTSTTTSTSSTSSTTSTTTSTTSSSTTTSTSTSTTTSTSTSTTSTSTTTTSSSTTTSTTTSTTATTTTTGRAARRRRKKNSDNRGNQQRHNYFVFYDKHKGTIDLPKNRINQFTKNFNRISSIDQRDLLSNSLDITRDSLAAFTNNDQNQTNIRVSRVHQQDLPVQTGNSNIKVPQQEINDDVPINRQFSATVSRVKRDKNFQEHENTIQKKNSQNTDELNSANEYSNLTKTTQVHVIKLPRRSVASLEQTVRNDQTYRNLEPNIIRSRNFGSVSVTTANSNQLTLTNRSANKSTVVNDQTKRYRNVTVSKLEKKSAET
ncbi:unnamed protein product [Rotaria sordida]|uniref:Uncharacterized protein n=1 Tax=Rotaria sordida TaxID=392033 RepID=A0A819EY70_9BILA|nr:unnamed protein product [Rotaria sordida]CAF3858607.1 unnamed protein product [Rotaria sordida]